MSTGGELADLFDDDKRGPVLRLHVQPGANREGVVGVHGRALKLKVRAPAVDGKANEAVLRLLARQFGVPVGSLSLIGGGSARDKRVLFGGCPLPDFVVALGRVVAQAGDGGA